MSKDKCPSIFSPQMEARRATASGKSHGMRAICELSWVKNWKRSKRVCWTKITIIFNTRNVYLTKDIQPWSESLKSVQVWVIEKSYNCALEHYSGKNTAKNFDHHVMNVKSKLCTYQRPSQGNIAGFADLCPQYLAWDGGIGSLLHFWGKIHRERPARFVTSKMKDPDHGDWVYSPV